MSTDTFTTHRHTQSKTVGASTQSAGAHAHGTTTIDGLITALTTRVTALEQAAVPVPTNLVATVGSQSVSLAWS